jgi:hypothetical protein
MNLSVCLVRWKNLLTCAINSLDSVSIWWTMPVKHSVRQIYLSLLILFVFWKVFQPAGLCLLKHSVRQVCLSLITLSVLWIVCLFLEASH